ncbi:MAG: hypothetical protein NZ602_02080 [Thermoguttaceae bacterium]|nr:hypothetical protein [Thermoguttaceae bacterium]MDW8039778.1 hypothetical protein [Thermoguttaceae bacterium]
MKTLQNWMAHRRFGKGMLVALALLVAGCGGQPYAVVPIRGKVTYEDGSLIPAASLMLEFNSQEKPKDPKTYPRPGRAEVNVADGTFSNVSTYDPNDGAIRGEHKVVVKAYDKNGSPVYHLFPKEYSDATTTPLTINVGDQREFHIKVPKPAGVR